MKVAGSLAYTALVCFLLLLIGESKCANTSDTTAVNASLPDETPGIPLRNDDEDDFVPYQGERFSVFDWSLFRAMGKKYTGNLLISPISIKLALVLLYEGAQDQSAQELAGVLQLPVSRSATRDKFSTILQSLKAPSSSYTLNIGTRLYVDSNVLVRQRYEAIVKTFYDTDLITANLSESHAVAEGINSWVSNITDGNIKKMIEDESSVKDSVMLALNALFFKGSWRRKYFSTDNTHTAKFYTGTNKSVNVEFMNTMSRLYYSESSELDAKILRIPYDGQKFAMYLVLPSSVNGVDNLLNKINPFILTRHVWLMQDLTVDVSIPKFKFDFSSRLETILRELGIRDIFDDTATLTGIARTRRTSRHLKVTDILQKTGIEVNENGTVAYAATEVQVGNKIEAEIFHANRPFIFYIEDESTGTILYMGKITNPLDTAGATQIPIQEFPTRFNEEASTAALPSAPTAEERYNYFNIDLLQAVSEEVEGNLILSPTSAKLALTILAEGTGGRTRQEILSALRLPGDNAKIRAISQRTFASLKRIENGTEIDTATRLWIEQTAKLSANYPRILQQYYGSDVQLLNFVNAENSANTINKWVRLVTREKIQTLVDSGSIGPETRLVLTSALYFKGRWLKSFDKQLTRVRCFYVPNEPCQNTYFMENMATYRYAHIPSLDADVIEIPYSDRKTAMLILLPAANENDQNLRILSKDLSYVSVSQLLASLQDTEVFLSVPKFSIESKLDLRSPLIRMGIRDMFEGSSNLTGIASDNFLRVGSVIQDAKIEVDEDGTIAAAVTGLTIVPFMGSNTQNFKANRPFIFMIVDLETKGTLFSGRVIRPNSNGNNNIPT